MRPTALLLAAITGILTIAGRHDAPTAPSSAAQGRYVLLSVGDSTLPYVLYSTTDYDARRVADTLVIDGRGHAAETTVLSFDSTMGRGSSRQSYRSSMTYVQRFDSLYFAFDCPPNAMVVCALPPVGWLLRDGRLQLGTTYEQNGQRVWSPLATYRRLGPPPADLRAPMGASFAR